MNTYLTSKRTALAAVGGLLAFLSLSGVALAATDNVYRYSTLKTGYLTLLPAAFTPADTTKDYVNNGIAIRPLTAGQQHCWSAPVNLPQGAKMTALALYYQLENGDSALVQFYRKRLSDGVGSLPVNQALALTGGAYRGANFPITDASVQTVNNGQYGYSLFVCFTENGAGTSSIFHGARVTYTYTHAGD
jgi:hypothetical protein